MTDRERRQKRLLAVRALQADLAAAEVRALRTAQDEDSREVASLNSHQTTGPAPAHEDWLLACAERELAAMQTVRLLVRMDERAAEIERQAQAERACRQAREQMRMLCDSTRAQRVAAEERSWQAQLDDLFQASLLHGADRSPTNS